MERWFIFWIVVAITLSSDYSALWACLGVALALAIACYWLWPSFWAAGALAKDGKRPAIDS